MGYFVRPYWYLFTLFVGLNLFQSAFTKWCLAEEILKKFGIGVPCSSEGSTKSKFESKKTKSVKMEVLILATKDCNHRPQVEEKLKQMNISYSVKYIDEHPELVEKFGAHSSPNIVVDGTVVFRADQERSLPTKGELKAIFSS